MELPNSPDLVIENITALPQYTLIELPCLVQRVTTGISMLGGDEQLRLAINSGVSTLPLRISANPIAPPLVGRVETTSGLLLKVTRNKRTGITRIEAIGKIESAYRYISTADFQFLPKESQDSTAPVVIEAVPRPFAYTRNMDPFFLFKSTNIPVLGKILGKNVTSLEVGKGEYDGNNVTELMSVVSAEDNHIAEQGGSGVGGTAATSRHTQQQQSRDRLHTPAQMVNLGDTIPEGPPAADLSRDRRKGTAIKVRTTVAVLDGLFRGRPISTRRVLEVVGVIQANKYVFVLALPLVAYFIPKSPFNQCWVRYKYDPTQHPESRFMQTVRWRLSFQLHRELFDKIKNFLGKYANIVELVNLDEMTANILSTPAVAAAISSSSGISKHDGMHVTIFGILLSRQNTAQICDLSDEALLACVRGMKRLPSCDLAKGWYSDEQMDALRGVLAGVVRQRVDHFTSLVLQDVLRKEPPLDLTSVTLNCEWYDRYLSLPDIVMSSEEMAAYQRRTEAKVVPTERPEPRVLQAKQTSKTALTRKPARQAVKNKLSGDVQRTKAVAPVVKQVRAFQLVDEDSSEDEDEGGGGSGSGEEDEEEQSTTGSFDFTGVEQMQADDGGSGSEDNDEEMVFI